MACKWQTDRMEETRSFCLNQRPECFTPTPTMWFFAIRISSLNISSSGLLVVLFRVVLFLFSFISFCFVLVLFVCVGLCLFVFVCVVCLLVMLVLFSIAFHRNWSTQFNLRGYLHRVPQMLISCSLRPCFHRFDVHPGIFDQLWIWNLMSPLQNPLIARPKVVWDEDLGGVLDHWFVSGFSPLSRSWNCSHLQQLGIVPWSYRMLDSMRLCRYLFMAVVL